MRGEQARLYQPRVDEMKRRIREVKGWEEDDSEVPIPVENRLWCQMDNYRWHRSLQMNGMMISNPNVTIGVRAFQAKSHLNRFIGCVEDVDPTVVNVYAAVVQAVRALHHMHPGLAHQVHLSANGGVPMEAYLTGAPQTQEVDVTVFAHIDGDETGGELTAGFSIKVPFHTVCPFMIFEADGHSHTQRTYVTTRVSAPTSRITGDLFDFRPILKEMNTRMTPSQSRMKIPDEAYHCLRAYSTPTYTEFGAMQVLSILRDTKSEWLQGADRIVRAHINIQSVESIFCNDIVSDLDAEI